MRRALPFLLLLAACSSVRPIPAAWNTTPVSTRIRSIALDDRGNVTLAPLLPLASPVRVENNRLVRDGKRLTEQFVAIESFDYSAKSDEVIFSARRVAENRGFDIGLVAGDGSKTNWAPADPADEVMVQWAPRGYKASYVVRAPLGDVVRTLHIPSSFQYAIDFGPATIYDVAWEPKGEKYAVAYSTIDASDRVEVLRYDGTDRAVTRKPDLKLDADVVSFAPGAFALRPRDLRYSEKLPVVVWLSDRFEWSDGRYALMRGARVALVIAHKEDEALRKAVSATSWMDAERTFVVSTDPTVPAGYYRFDGRTLAAAPAAIQSVAAGFIADQLKRTSRTNGSR
ncbi:MAG TPA: hypothetical protein VM733_21130 [Thermoanaerobaculia bacterium]|nr:hypothetical protein [Thermoanaerobaculia bacterium]